MDKQDVISSLAALAQDTRLDVFRSLVQAGPEGLAAGAIGTALGISPATLSFHLKELKSSGLIHCERHGTSRIYTPNLSAVTHLIDFLTANCCRGMGGTGPTGEDCDFRSGTNCQSEQPANEPEEEE